MVVCVCVVLRCCAVVWLRVAFVCCGLCVLFVGVFACCFFACVCLFVRDVCDVCVCCLCTCAFLCMRLCVCVFVCDLCLCIVAL